MQASQRRWGIFDRAGRAAERIGQKRGKPWVQKAPRCMWTRSTAGNGKVDRRQGCSDRDTGAAGPWPVLGEKKNWPARRVMSRVADGGRLQRRPWTPSMRPRVADAGVFRATAWRYEAGTPSGARSGTRPTQPRGDAGGRARRDNIMSMRTTFCPCPGAFSHHSTTKNMGEATAISRATVPSVGAKRSFFLQGAGKCEAAMQSGSIWTW